MENLQSLEDSILVDLLARHTENYTAMYTENRMNTDEFNICKITIKAILKELQNRKAGTNTSISDGNILIPDEDL